MKKYCKAYLLADLRAFPDWSASAHPDERELTDESLVYLDDEFKVLACPVGKDKDKVLFGEVTPEWQEFCTQALKFEIPEDLAFAYTDAEQG